MFRNNVLRFVYTGSREIMGGKQSVFTEEQLEQYQDCSFFTKKEILHIWRRFAGLSPNRIDPRNGEANELRLNYEEIKEMPELKENPFKDRMCQVFSTNGDGSLSFEDFLDMFSVFSEAAPWDLKATYAFRIYDFDEDNFIDKNDLELTVKRLTHDELTEQEVNIITDRVMAESDLDHDQKLSYVEFEHIISRSPDFINVFHIRI